MKRRRFVAAGAAAGAVLAVELATGPGPLVTDPSAVIVTVAPIILAGALPESPAARQAALREVVQGVDVAIAGLPLETQHALAQLFELLGFAPARRLVARVWSPWSVAPSQEIDAFLRAWRASGSMRLRAAYDALHQLVLASWYGNPASWARIGYPGPPKLGSSPPSVR